MDEYTIRQAIDLIKARRPLDARKLLRPVLEVNPENEAAWVWFTSTFISPQDKLQVMRMASLYCPNSQPVLRGIEKLLEEIQEAKDRGESIEQSDLSAYFPHLAQAMEPEDNFKPGDLPASWQTSALSQPVKKEPSKPIKTAQEDAVDWINQLRITTTDEAAVEKPIRAPFSWEEPDLPVFEPEPVKQPEPVPQPVYKPAEPSPWKPEPMPVSPPQHTRDVPPWEMPMQSTELSDRTYQQKKAPHIQQNRIKMKDPYQGPFVTAASIGGVLLLILAIIVYIILIQTT